MTRKKAVTSKPSRRPTTFGRLTRSELMSRIRSTGNKTTETSVLGLLRKNRVTGWRRHVNLLGKPDFAWEKRRVVLFIDGCFWHGHDCGRNLTPKRNVAFWQHKILTNRRRDRRIRVRLRKLGWTVLRIWECQLVRNPDRCLYRIRIALQRAVLGHSRTATGRMKDEMTQRVD